MMQSRTAAGASAPALRLSGGFAVMLSYGGLFVGKHATHDERELSFPDLNALIAWSTMEPLEPDYGSAELAQRFGGEAEALAGLLVDLYDRRFAVAHAAPAPVVEAQPPARPADLGPVDGSRSVSVGAPRLLRVVSDGFEVVDYFGEPVVRLSPAELHAMGRVTVHTSVNEAFDAHVAEAADHSLGRSEFDAITALMISHRLLEYDDESTTVSRDLAWERSAYKGVIRAQAVIRGEMDRRLEEGYELESRTGRKRTHIIPVQTQPTMPLSLGMIVGYAKNYEGGRLGDHYHFLPSCYFEPERFEEVIERGSIYLFTDYIWSHGKNLHQSARAKRMNPRSIIVHGGPDAPKYEGDVEAYFEANPFIDVVVHGEGEVTFSAMLAALVPTLDDEVRDLSVLEGVEGLSYRGPDGVVTNPPRDRLTDLNEIPSPYLSGLYSAYGDGAIDTAMIETNRGCPYQCTFCDWGSSTASRIRKFDLDRVLAEIEWCAKAGVRSIFLCDANFGIFERDIEIARKVAECRQTYGFPKGFTTNYAKNTVKHLQQIVQIMASAGVVTEGLLSLQSMNDDTLKTIRRSNIKVEKYDALAAEFREAELPLWVDLMIGLPGSTPQSLLSDFQECIDREVNAKVFQTELLVNSPMNEPSYFAENKIVTERNDGSPSTRIPTRGSHGAGRALVVSSSSFTRSDYDVMLESRGIFRLMENFAVLRVAARFLRQETGVKEGELIDRLRRSAHYDPDRWRYLALATSVVPEMMLPPVSWKLFIDDLRDFAVTELGAKPSSGLEAVLAAQHAVLPASGRVFPYRIELEHDVAAWYREVLRSKDEGHRTEWELHVPHLDTFGPASFLVDDPDGVCTVGIGYKNQENDHYATWELRSPIQRALAASNTTLSLN